MGTKYWLGMIRREEVRDSPSGHGQGIVIDAVRCVCVCDDLFSRTTLRKLTVLEGDLYTREDVSRCCFGGYTPAQYKTKNQSFGVKGTGDARKPCS